MLAATKIIHDNLGVVFERRYSGFEDQHPFRFPEESKRMREWLDKHEMTAVIHTSMVMFENEDDAALCLLTFKR